MASNNYAEFMSDPIEARKILDRLRQFISLGWEFKVMEFNPNEDLFPISCGRVSNFPPLPDVETNGSKVDSSVAQALWMEHGNTIEAVSFGNRFIGAFFESEGLGYMIIPDEKSSTRDYAGSPEGSAPVSDDVVSEEF